MAIGYLIGGSGLAVVLGAPLFVIYMVLSYQQDKAEKSHIKNVDIIKGEKLKSYSVADELLKWAKLKEDGHISEEEYNQARKKLLENS